MFREVWEFAKTLGFIMLCVLIYGMFVLAVTILFALLCVGVIMTIIHMLGGF